jgi:PAS domain-containing protein
VGIYTQLHQHRLRLRRTEDQQKLIDAQLSARREELEQRSAQITTLLESISDPVFVVWGNKITESNTPALRLFGFDSYDQMSQDLDRFFENTQPRDAVTGHALAAGAHPYFKALQGERAFGQIMVRNAKTGRDQIIRCGAHPVRFRDKILGVVMVHTPVDVGRVSLS